MSARSLYAVAARLRDDGDLPIRLRMNALAAAHRLAVGGSVAHDSERELRRLYAQRRQLAALARLYS